MNLVANWNPEYIKSLAACVQKVLEEEIYSDIDPTSYSDEEGVINLCEQDEAESVLANLLADDNLLGIVESDDFADLAYEVFQAIPQKFFDDFKSQFKEKIQEIKAYTKNPLGYHGVSMRDFVNF
jgi:hypothetical protein